MADARIHPQSILPKKKHLYKHKQPNTTAANLKRICKVSWIQTPDKTQVYKTENSD